METIKKLHTFTVERFDEALAYGWRIVEKDEPPPSDAEKVILYSSSSPSQSSPELDFLSVATIGSGLLGSVVFTSVVSSGAAKSSLLRTLLSTGISTAVIFPLSAGFGGGITSAIVASGKGNTVWLDNEPVRVGVSSLLDVELKVHRLASYYTDKVFSLPWSSIKDSVQKGDWRLGGNPSGDLAPVEEAKQAQWKASDDEMICQEFFGVFFGILFTCAFYRNLANPGRLLSGLISYVIAAGLMYSPGSGVGSTIGRRLAPLLGASKNE